MERTRYERLLFWLDSGTLISKAAMAVLEWLAFFIGGAITLWCAHQIEERWMPVITNWTIDYAHREGNSYIVGGLLTKERPCELLAVSVMAVPVLPMVPKVLIYHAPANEINGGNVPTGRTTWGPWSVKIPAGFEEKRHQVAYLSVVGTHRCHALWSQETTYGHVPMEMLK